MVAAGARLRELGARIDLMVARADWVGSYSGRGLCCRRSAAQSEPKVSLACAHTQPERRWTCRICCLRPWMASLLGLVGMPQIPARTNGIPDLLLDHLDIRKSAVDLPIDNQRLRGVVDEVDPEAAGCLGACVGNEQYTSNPRRVRAGRKGG